MRLSGQRVVALSAHADDAIWSCGGILASLVAQGAILSILTAFDGGPVRRAEDDAACRQLGVLGRCLGLVDAKLRRGADGKLLYSGPMSLRRAIIHQHDLVSNQLVEILRPILADTTAVILPLAQGTHVDHVALRYAVEHAAPAAATLLYYRDFLYPETAPDFPAFSVVFPITVEPWQTASLCYNSQIRFFFGNTARFQAVFHAHFQASRGELLMR